MGGESAGIAFSGPGAVLAEVKRRGRELRLTRWRTFAIAPDLLAESPLEPNLRDPQVLAFGLRNQLTRRRLAVGIPDAAARVSVLRAVAVPAEAGERERWIRWQLEKSLLVKLGPVRIEHQIFPTRPEKRLVEPKASNILVAAVDPRIVQQYEDVVREGGGRPDRVGLNIVNLFNLFFPRMREGAGAEWVFVASVRSSLSILIWREDAPELIRIKTFRGMEVEPKASNKEDSLAQRMVEEVRATLSFYEGQFTSPRELFLFIDRSFPELEKRARAELDAMSVTSLEPGAAGLRGLEELSEAERCAVIPAVAAACAPR